MRESDSLSRVGAGSVLASLTLPILVMSVRSDELYPPAEQQEIVEHTPNSEFYMIESDEGHDGFLIEFEKMSDRVLEFLKRQAPELY